MARKKHEEERPRDVTYVDLSEDELLERGRRLGELAKTRAERAKARRDHQQKMNQEIKRLDEEIADLSEQLRTGKEAVDRQEEFDYDGGNGAADDGREAWRREMGIPPAAPAPPAAGDEDHEPWEHYSAKGLRPFMRARGLAYTGLSKAEMVAALEAAEAEA